MRRVLWISFIAALMPAATLTSALLASDTDWTSGVAAIVLALAIAIAGAMMLPIAVWAFCAALILRKMQFSDGTARLLFIASFAALFMLVAALPDASKGGGDLAPVTGQEFFIGVTALGKLLRQAPLLGFVWLFVIACAAYAPPWLGLLMAVIGAGALSVILADQQEAQRQGERAPFCGEIPLSCGLGGKPTALRSATGRDRT